MDRAIRTHMRRRLPTNHMALHRREINTNSRRSSIQRSNCCSNRDGILLTFKSSNTLERCRPHNSNNNSQLPTVDLLLQH